MKKERNNAPKKKPQEEAEAPLWLVRTLQTLAYGIPLTFLAYVLYINYLPFGYEKTFTIDVGAEGDTDSSQAFYLEPSPDLSERKVAEDGSTYRELNGIAYAIFNPPVVLKDAEITVSVEGEGVSIIPPVIDFDPDDYEWDYEWDFTNEETAFQTKISDEARQRDWTRCSTSTAEVAEWLAMGGTKVPPPTATLSETRQSSVATLSSLRGGVPQGDDAAIYSASTPTETCVTIPVPDLEGNAFWFDGGMYFDGQSRLEMPGTVDLFENGPFTVYVEWTPQSSEGDNQQLAGHYNWELFQGSESIKFTIGRLNHATGSFESIEYAITDPKVFFNNTHELVAYYIPDQKSKRGYFGLYIDGVLVQTAQLRGDAIWQGYGAFDLSFGDSMHGSAETFVGTAKAVRYMQKNSLLQQYTYFAEPAINQWGFGVVSNGNDELIRRIILYTSK